jgi:hypothetical protein
MQRILEKQNRRQIGSGYDEQDQDRCRKKTGWVNPANTRKSPSSEEEIDRFVEDFILGLDAPEWVKTKLKYGEHEARKRIRASMVKIDENKLANITPKGPVN